MKNFALFLVISLVANGASAGPIKLFDRQTCITSYIKCEKPTTFVHDIYGRCSCLRKGDYMPIQHCIESIIDCAPGTELSHLKDLDGNTIGCGCYATAQTR